MGYRGSFPGLMQGSEFEYRKDKQFSLHGVEDGSGATHSPAQWVPGVLSHG